MKENNNLGEVSKDFHGPFRPRAGTFCVHFIGFRGEEFWSAVKAFGHPDFIHRGWNLRARREIAAGDLIVFATGPANQEPRRKSFDDSRKPENDA